MSIEEKDLMDKFPGTRYMGSKNRLLGFIWDCVKDLEFKSVLDAFSGSACVSYMFKRHNKQVYSNDHLMFSYHYANALIENSKTKLNKANLELLLQNNQGGMRFVTKTFKGLYFTNEENKFLDRVRTNIDLVKDEYKKSLAIAALSRACLKKRPRGIFTFTGNRYNDGRRDIRISLKDHFIESVALFNDAVVDNGMKNNAFNKDIFALDLQPDLVYIDPPYFTKNSDNDYTRRYHFVEGLAKYWDGLEIQFNTKTKKFKKYETPFSSKDTIDDAFDRLFKKFRKSILVVSYSSNSLPDKKSLTEMIKTYKKKVTVYQVDHLYSFGTHNHKIGDNANRVKEYLFVGE